MKEKIIIPATIKKGRDLIEAKDRKIRVCAYVRVSTDFKEQVESFNSQIARYTRIIKEEHKDNWIFAGIFTDEKSGKSAKARDGFNRMIDACREHKIDLILCKQMSRFARNTVDSLRYIYELRRLGIEIFFEEDNLYGSNTQLDFNIAMYAAFAQEESRQTSVRVAAGIKERLQSGKIEGFLRATAGFRKDKNKNIYIYEPEAAIIRLIYNLYLSGIIANSIDVLLNRDLDHEDYQYRFFTKASTYRILDNLRYNGDVLLQKTFMQSHLDKYATKNIGQKPKYLFKDVNEKIIPDHFFQLVRQNRPNHLSPLISNDLSFLIFCGRCGRQINSGGASRKDKRDRYYCCSFNNKDRSCNSMYIDMRDFNTITNTILRRYFLTNKFIKEVRNLLYEVLLPVLGAKARHKVLVYKAKLDDETVKKIELNTLAIQNPTICYSDEYKEKLAATVTNIEAIKEAIDISSPEYYSKGKEWKIKRFINAYLNDLSKINIILKIMKIKIIQMVPFDNIYVKTNYNVTKQEFMQNIPKFVDAYKTMKKESSICYDKYGKLRTYTYKIINYEDIIE